jgi:phosphoglycerate dehydrogenase-like enzyme
MLIGCDLFTSSLDFQKITYKDLVRLKKKFINLKIIKVNPKIKNDTNYSKIQVYWGNRININILKKMRSLKWIHYGSTGINRDIENYANKKNIKLSNTRKMFDNSVAATAMGFIFCLSRSIQYPLFFRGSENYGRDFYNKIYFNMNDVFKKKILFVGYGNIAKKIAKICKSMDMQIFTIRKTINKKLKNSFNIKNLNKAVKEKDFIVNLLPSTEKTKEIFNYKIFKNMNKKSFFINMGRGETVNEKDLENAIKKNHIAGAGLDVVQNEPFKKDLSLLKYNNVIITPHIAGINTRYKKEQVDLFMDNYNKFLKNKKLKFLVRRI